jgi:hypothetical protein
LGRREKNRPSTFADIMYVNRSYLRLSIRKKSRSIIKGKQKISGSIFRQVSADSQRPFRRSTITEVTA